MGPGGELEQVVEAQHAEAAGPLEQRVEELDRGVASASARWVEGGRGEGAGQGGQAAVGHLFADEAAGDGARVDPAVGQRG